MKTTNIEMHETTIGSGNPNDPKIRVMRFVRKEGGILASVMVSEGKMSAFVYDNEHLGTTNPTWLEGKVNHG